ncbi:ureidoglycolate dehydrogenase (NAD+) [Kroppenstedtia sanguinis]|uniref:ureidoglycolate dehydrogenase n=1 Tax=Kroppenstedtia sanguinis TaxID=1380684 RepID=UPI003D1F06E6
MKIAVNELKQLVGNKFRNQGIDAESAELIADVLVYADLRGVSSHGVMRVEHYITRLKAGGIQRNPNFTIHRLNNNHLIFDGNDGFGHVICKKAMDESIAVAKEHGSCTTVIQNSSHCGALSYFIEQATREDFIAIMFAQTDSAVVPFGGSEQYFGTNPIAFGFPTMDTPILLDMATSNVALGKILYAREKNISVPESWGVDKNGVPTTNPHDIHSLTPLAGAKGYGLALVVDMLSGILANAAFGPHITKMYGDYEQKRKLGQFMYVLDPAVFTDIHTFKKKASQMVDELHNISPATNFEGVLVPGEPEQLKSLQLQQVGIDLPQAVYDYLVS